MHPLPRPVVAVVVAALALGTPIASFAQRTAVEAEHGIVSSVHGLASEAGVEIMRQGGNAGF